MRRHDIRVTINPSSRESDIYCIRGTTTNAMVIDQWRIIRLVHFDNALRFRNDPKYIHVDIEVSSLKIENNLIIRSPCFHVYMLSLHYISYF